MGEALKQMQKKNMKTENSAHREKLKKRNETKRRKVWKEKILDGLFDKRDKRDTHVIQLWERMSNLETETEELVSAVQEQALMENYVNCVNYNTTTKEPINNT